MTKTLLFIGGGREALPGVRLARAMGYRVVVSDRNPQAPCFAEADDHIVASTFDVDASVTAAVDFHRHRSPIDGVMCLATDVPLTVASIAEALHLPGIPVEVARLAMDKLAMKIKFAGDGVPIPWFSSVESADHLRNLVAERDCLLVIKPVDSRGSRGVLRLEQGVDLEWAYGQAFDHSPTGRVMVEQFLSGPQVSTESIMLDGVAHTPGFSDRNYEFLDRYAPHFIENGGDLPSHLPQEQQDAVCRLMQRAALSLGVENGVVKGDIVVSNGQPHVIELAARLSGGYFCTHEIPLNVGVSTVQAVIRLALGEPVDPADLRPRFRRGVAQRYLFPEPGRVVAIRGVEAARHLPGVAEIVMNVGPGDVVGSPTDSNAAAGMLLATGETREEAVRRVSAAVDTIVVETEPL